MKCWNFQTPILIVLLIYLQTCNTNVIPLAVNTVGTILYSISEELFNSPQNVLSRSFSENLDSVKDKLFHYYQGQYNCACSLLMIFRVSYNFPEDHLFSERQTSNDIQGRGWIGFPSLEGALLSLAFLTFSVLLIDLIQVTVKT